MAHNAKERLMAPDIVLKRRDVEIADQDRPLSRRLIIPGPIHHFVDESELVGELDVDFRIRLVAASRNIEIVKFEPLRVSAKDDMLMTRVSFGAKVSPGECGKRNARNNRDPVIALLPVDRDMRIARVPKRPEREIGVRAFRLLQTQNIGLVLKQISDHKIDAQTHRVDIPCGDRKRHPRFRIMGIVTFLAAAASARERAILSTAAVGQRLRLPSWLAGRFSSMWKSAGSGRVVRSTLNRVTTVWKPWASMTVHCFNAKVDASKTNERCAVPPSAARSSSSIVIVLPSWETFRSCVSRARSMWSESRNLSGVWPMKYSSCGLSFLSTIATLRPSAMISKRGGSVYSNRI